MPPILHLATASHMQQPTDVCASQISHQEYRRESNTGHGNFGFSGFQVDGRTGFGGRGACGWADAPPPKSKDQSLFPLRTAPPSPRISPKHMDGRQARASVPIPPSPPPCRRLPARSPHPNRNAAHPPPARGAWAREYAANGTGRQHCRPAPAQESKPLGIPFSGNASVFPPSLRPPKRRRRTAPALGPSAVCALYRRNRNETKQDRPLLVGRSCVTNAPKALVAGTAGPPAHGAWARKYGANGTGRRHCRPAPAQESKPLGIPFSGNASVFPPLPVPQNRRRRQAPARGPAAVYALCRRNRNETKQVRPLLVGRSCVTNAPKALSAGTAGLHPLKSPNPWESPFLETPPFSPHLSVPQNAAGGRPLLLGRPPSTRTVAPFGPKRSTPAPCSWGGCASTSSQRHCQPALPAARWSLARMAGMAIWTNTARSRMEPLMVSLISASRPKEEMILSIMV